MRRLLILVCMAGLCSVTAQAQIVQSVNRFTTPGDSEEKAATAVAKGADDKGAKALSQGNIDASSEGMKVGIQAADLWMNKYFRFYGRLTLPVTESKKDAAKPAPSDQAGAGAAATTPATTPKLAATARQQLMDPYGGLFNISGGLFVKISPEEKVTERAAQETADPARVRSLAPQEHIRTDEQVIHRQMPRRNALVAAAINVDKQSTREQESTPQKELVQEKAAKLQDAHGLFLDFRTGFKFIDLPNAGDSNPDVAGTKVNVFYSTILGLKLITPLYNAEPGNDPTANAAHRTGGLTIGAYLVHNQAADKTQSDVYQTLLNRSTLAATGMIGWDLPSTDVAALTFSFTPWANDARLGKTFVFGLTLKQKTPEDKKQ